jgi:hypothetical protein
MGKKMAPATFWKLTMKTSPFALALVAVLAGCAQQQPSTSASGASGSMTGFDSHMCQTLRGYLGKGEDQRVQEACVRQLGAEGCKQCMAGTR